MTTKTLGQALYDADHDPQIYLPFAELSAERQAKYERLAQAVAAVVREQAVMACEVQIDAIRPRCIEYTGHVHSIGMCIAAIKQLKP